jgi:hypothetical protein
MVSSFKLPTVAQKYPLVQRYCPQYFFFNSEILLVLTLMIFLSNIGLVY